MAVTNLLEIGFGETFNSIAKLKAELKVLNTEFQKAEIGTAAYNKLGNGVKVLDAEIKSLTNATKANTQALGGINQSAKFAEGSLGKLKQQIKSNSDELLKVNVNGKLFKALQIEQGKAIQQRIDIEKKLPSMFQERIKLAIDESNSIKGLRAALKAAMSDMVAGVDGAGKRVAALKDQLDDLKDATNTLKGTGIERLTTSMGLLREAFSNFDGDKAKTAFEGIGSAMKAIPIFLILEGIKLLIENFDKIWKYFQAFSAEAKAVKSLTEAYDKLVISSAKRRGELEQSIAVQEANLELLRAQGKSSYELEAAERKIIASKIDLIRHNAFELKQGAMLNASKLHEIQNNDSLYESAQRLASNVAGFFGLEKAKAEFDKENQKNKKERAKEDTDALAEKMKQAKEMETELLLLDKKTETDKLNNAREHADKRIAADRELKQLLIDNEENLFKRSIKQSEFDEANRKEDLLRTIDYHGKKEKVITEIENKAFHERELLVKEEAERLLAIRNNFSQMRIDLIQNDFEKQQEQIKLNEQIALKEAENNILLTAEQLQETKVAITKKYAEENRRLALDYVKKDMEAEAALVIEQDRFNFEQNFAAKQELLKVQHENEMLNFQGTANEKLLAEQKYVNDSLQITKDAAAQKQAMNAAEITMIRDMALVAINIGSLLTKDKEQQAKFAKAAALVMIGSNTAIAISNLMATSFGPSTLNIATGGLAAYANLAAGLLTITTNMLQAKAQLNSFEEGGYTGEGAANEVSTNLGSKPYTYHKSEYVIPARVLGTKQGSMLASQAEGMRLGMSNPMPYIGGMFDGGFTNRSVGAGAESSFNQSQSMKALIAAMPQPVVKVTDINKVNSNMGRAIQTSSL